MPYDNFDTTGKGPFVALPGDSGRKRNLNIRPTVDNKGNQVYNPDIDLGPGWIIPGTGQDIPEGMNADGIVTQGLASRSAALTGVPAPSSGPTTNYAPTGEQPSSGTYDPNAASPKAANYQSTGQPASSAAASTTGVGASNPTDVSQSGKSYGEGADQFMIDPFLQPFDFEGQKAEGQSYVSGLTEFLQSQESLNQMYDRIGSQLDLPRQRENVMQIAEGVDQLAAALKGVPDSVRGRTRNSLVTDAQANRIIAKESEGLGAELSDLQNAGNIASMRLQASEEELSKRMGLEQAQQQKFLLPWEKEYDLLTQRQAREFSGYTFANQLELNRLISNQNAGLTWTNAEKQRAHELAMQEQAFKNQLETLTHSSKLRTQEYKDTVGLSNLASAFFG